MNDNIKTSVDIDLNILKNKEKNTSVNQVNNYSTLEQLELETLNVDNILEHIPKTGKIESNEIDYSRIATNTYDAVAGRFLSSVSTNWGENGTLTYEIRDDGSVLIRSDDVAMGYTDIYGISKIITNLNFEEDIKEPSLTTYSNELGKIDYSNINWNDNSKEDYKETKLNSQQNETYYNHSATFENDLENIKKMFDDKNLEKNQTYGENGEILLFDKKIEQNGDISYFLNDEIIKTAGNGTIFYPDSGNIYIVKSDKYQILNKKLSSDLISEGYTHVVDTYFSNGTRQTKLFKDSFSEIYEYDKNDNISLLSNSDGLKITFFENGNKKEIYDLDGSKTEYYENGNLKSILSDTIDLVYDSDGKILRNGKATYEYNDLGQLVKANNVSDKISKISNYYLEDGRQYRFCEFKDGTYSLIEYENDGKQRKSYVKGTFNGTDSETGLPIIYGDTYFYTNNVLSRKILSNGLTIDYESNDICNISYLDSNINMNCLLNDKILSKVNINDISDINVSDNLITVKYNNGYEVLISNTNVFLKNKNNPVLYGYNIDSDGGLSSIDIFDDKNTNNNQCGGSQSVFHLKNNSYELLEDEKIGSCIKVMGK